MKRKNNPILIHSVNDLKKFVICGGGNQIYVSNLLDPKIIISFLELSSDNIKVILFDHKEYENGTIDLKRNGRCKFKLNKNVTILKQKYYFYSKNKIKYYTTMWDAYVKKNCNYTKEVQNFRFMQSQIFYASYENTTELINNDKHINISKQSIYNYERLSCKIFPAQREAELWKKIKKLEIKASGYYHYDEEYIKINKEVYVRLSLIDAHTYIIINDIIIPKIKFNKEFIKKFLTDSLDGLKLNTIITDGHRSYPEIIDELGAKHQLCIFHIMQTLMKPLSKKIRGLKRRIESYENKITKKQEKIDKLANEYPYGPGRPPKEDKKACKNVKDRQKLKMEKSKLTTQLEQYNNELKQVIEYKEKIKKIFKFKTLKTSMKKFNEILKEENLPTIIHDFLKNLNKKIDRALQFTQDKSIPKTNNLIELFYKVTFPGKIKRIYRTLEGVENRIRLNNIRWMERNVLGKYDENIPNQ